MEAPIRTPKLHHKLIHPANGKSSAPQLKQITVDAVDEYNTIYIAVEVATSGGTPIDIISGLKMELPPMPIAPLTQPPQNAKKSRKASWPPRQRISLGTRPRPTFNFRACSLLFINTPSKDSDTIKTEKDKRIAPSRLLHLLTLPGSLLVPRMKLTKRLATTVESASKCFDHCFRCEVSLSKSQFSQLISSLLAYAYSRELISQLFNSDLLSGFIEIFYKISVFASMGSVLIQDTLA